MLGAAAPPDTCLHALLPDGQQSIGDHPARGYNELGVQPLEDKHQTPAEGAGLERERLKRFQHPSSLLCQPADRCTLARKKVALQGVRRSGRRGCKSAWNRRRRQQGTAAKLHRNLGWCSSLPKLQLSGFSAVLASSQTVRHSLQHAEESAQPRAAVQGAAQP